MVWWKSLWFPRKSIQLMVPAPSAHIARNQPLWDVTEGKHTSHRFALTIKDAFLAPANWFLSPAMHRFGRKPQTEGQQHFFIIALHGSSTPLESGIRKKKVKM